MKEIRELISKLLEECQREKISVMVGYGKDKTYLAEWGTLSDNTPDRIKRARTAFVSAPSQSKGQMEFD